MPNDKVDNYHKFIKWKEDVANFTRVSKKVRWFCRYAAGAAIADLRLRSSWRTLSKESVAASPSSTELPLLSCTKSPPLVVNLSFDAAETSVRGRGQSLVMGEDRRFQYCR